MTILSFGRNDLLREVLGGRVECDTLYPYIHIYIIIYMEMQNYIKEILFSEYKRFTIGKRFTSTLIIKLKTYEIKV